MCAGGKVGDRKVQCKNIPDVPVLEFLRDQDRWCTWFIYDDSEAPENSVLRVMPEGTPAKLALAKMRQLIRRGLVDGCGCGCRGDFELSRKGREFLAAQGGGRISTD